MTIPSEYKRNTVGGAFTEQKVGGVVIGITSATDTTDGQPVTEVSALKDQGIDGDDRRNAPKDTDITASPTSGAFAYDQSAFILIGNQANNKINNSASTALVLNGKEATTDSDRASVTPIGAKTSTAWRARSWQPLGITGQRTNWDSAPSAMNAADYTDPTTGSATAVPDGAVGTQAVPGELAYMHGALDAKQDDYKERTGA